MRRGIAVGAVMLAGLMLAGCSGASSTQATGEMPMSDAMVAEGGAPAVAPEVAAQDATDARVGSTGSVVTDRQVVRTGYVSMRVDDVLVSTGKVHALVKKLNGLISSEDAQSSGDSAYANITAQIPAADLDVFIADVSALGTVDSVNITAADVTSQVVDLDARIAALKTSIDRLSELLAQAQRMEDLLAIETQLSQRQSELDALTAQRTYLGEQVALSTITVSLAPVTTPVDVDAPGFLSGLESGWNAFLSVIMVAITALGFFLPFLLVLALIAIPIAIVIVRQARRHRSPQAPPVEAHARESVGADQP